VEIREQKAFTDRILESTTSAVIVIGHDRRVIMVNKAFEATFEIVKSKAEGKEIGEVVPSPVSSMQFPRCWRVANLNCRSSSESNGV